ncbi:hypothetical protein GCM10022254_32330 [Actinomadura meridiana]|uniref:Uncharacterized protein n=1 Tax=Actinomadura meridiana TaxID=559626 RepID=A0ABP8C3A1_9ACTN
MTITPSRSPDSTAIRVPSIIRSTFLKKSKRENRRDGECPAGRTPAAFHEVLHPGGRERGRRVIRLERLREPVDSVLGDSGVAENRLLNPGYLQALVGLSCHECSEPRVLDGREARGLGEDILAHPEIEAHRQSGKLPENHGPF